MKKQRHKPGWSHSKLLVIFVAGGVGLLGSFLLTSSFAATNNNPYGGIDSCQLEGANTVLYGWASDPNAPQGAQPSVTIKAGAAAVTIPTSTAGYRDAAVNEYINKYHPGDPTSGTYGFRAVFSGLYKGTVYAVSGTAINYGTGASQAMAVNHTHSVDSSTKPYFPGDNIPDVCLTTKPLPPPLPQPTPTPTPTPVKSTPKTPVKAAAPAAGALPSDAADGSVTAGTTSVAVKFPAGNATVARLVYGPDGDNSTETTPDAGTNNADTTITVTGLTPKTSYHYQIVRLLNDKTATSAASNFTTTGYTLSLQLTAGKKPVSGIIGQLDNIKATSDKDGKLTFKDQDAGSYSIRFTYKNHIYSQTVSTDTADPNDKPSTIVVSDTVNLDDLTKTATLGKDSGQRKSSAAPIIITVIILLLLAAGAVWFFLRRRSNASPYPDIPLAPPVSAVGGDILDQHSHHHLTKKAAPPPEPMPQNAGKSLRELVLESMRAEAAKRKSQQPPDDIPK